MVISVVFVLCVGHMKIKECLQFEQSVVHVLLNCYLLQKGNKLVRFVVSLILNICFWEFLGCMVVVEPNRSSEKRRLANVINERAPQWTFKKIYLVAFLGHTSWDNLKMHVVKVTPVFLQWYILRIIVLMCCSPSKFQSSSTGCGWVT